MKVVALIALAFGLANSTMDVKMRPWGTLFHGAIQTSSYMPKIKTLGDSDRFFLGQKSEQSNYYQDNTPQEGMKELLLQIEHLLQKSLDGSDVNQDNMIKYVSERIVERLEEIEESLLEQAIQRVAQDKLVLFMGYGPETVQQLVKGRAANILREIFESITSHPMMGMQQNTRKETLKRTLQTVFAVKMLNQYVKEKMPTSMIEINEVEKVVEQTILDDMERAVEESDRRLKHVQYKIQLLNQHLEKVKFYETLNSQQIEAIDIIEKVKLQVLDNLQELKINEMAYRMATISLQKLMINQEYAMQQVSFQQMSTMDELMMRKHHLPMQMMQ